MTKLGKSAIALVSLAAAALTLPAAAQASNPAGIWIDHTGRAAIEITDCAGKLCGKIVWLKEQNHKSACGMQIIGDVKPMKNGRWDGGWILDPEKDSKYDVEITPLGDQKLRVMGYAGMKFLSETFTWTRAGGDLKRCDATASLNPPKTDPGVPFTPPPQATPEPGATPGATPRATPRSTPGPGPSTGPGTAEPPAADKPSRKTAKKGCTLEIPYVKITIPCDDD